jgi:hypothetical protein
MTSRAAGSRGIVLLCGLACAASLLIAGCGGPSTDASVARQTVASPVETAAQIESPGEAVAGEPAAENRETASVVEAPIGEEARSSAAEFAAVGVTAVEKVSIPPVAESRKFAAEGPEGALRVGFDDLDLLKILKMDPVTPDCVEKMPGWLRDLHGKPVRIRGYMKPGLLTTGIPQFTFVRDTGLCCFGPKGKIHDLIHVTLKPGTTTDYIHMQPFDVVGKFRIELEKLEDDDMIYQLYCIDDATILRSAR